ncbi:MAG: AraC family ligand binding domain-containing protein [Clostridia bacterium]|nr:AraC family ligand binding domain-containing protein [Clostridia bacterium]
MSQQAYFRYPHRGVSVTESLGISMLYTVHLFYNEMDYPAPGEIHDFWEMLFVDEGEASVLLERSDAPYRLKTGMALMIPPEEYHCFLTNPEQGYSLFIISFSADNEALSCFIEKNLLHTSEFERQMIGEIVKEAQSNFADSLDKISMQQIHLSSRASADCLHKIRLLLELILINLRRTASGYCQPTPPRAPRGRQAHRSKTRKRRDTVNPLRRARLF